MPWSPRPRWLLPKFKTRQIRLLKRAQSSSPLKKSPAHAGLSWFVGKDKSSGAICCHYLAGPHGTGSDLPAAVAFVAALTGRRGLTLVLLRRCLLGRAVLTAGRGLALVLLRRCLLGRAALTAGRGLALVLLRRCLLGRAALTAGRGLVGTLTPLRSPPQTPPQWASFALFAGFIATMTRSDFSCPCIIGFGSSPSQCGPPYTHSTRRRRPDTRSPRFRCDPFTRDVAFDPGRASAPRITVPHMLPSSE